MECWIYRSSKKEGLYLYLGERDNFSKIPKKLQKIFGKLNLVMNIDLSAHNRLAQADIEMVKKSIKSQGFFLQFPPDYKPNLYHGNEI
tara:strand:- start:364 stop:627 length:264 start_codon:yes stop_codon:yes gene_type:complete